MNKRIKIYEINKNFRNPALETYFLLMLNQTLEFYARQSSTIAKRIPGIVIYNMNSQVLDWSGISKLFAVIIGMHCTESLQYVSRLS